MFFAECSELFLLFFFNLHSKKDRYYNLLLLITIHASLTHPFIHPSAYKSTHLYIPFIKFIYLLLFSCA